jgi:hypothetical protein
MRGSDDVEVLVARLKARVDNSKTNGLERKIREKES